mmetsp:Transcript_18011/g.58243  ORF Transcript_18011/g.58243 Transcript_18011/m.58243 type:complete len:358 (+) Transcript_18011:1341-2414(+)|eukprot:CAMPEP_0118893240 /NCGR_PEP_ID=MMETSP1166-20130328/2528_1 /TAXON_ID=1104430 /ORGANISM="Chrysoreinhardia sp, Strain CCMP3193" /LENGTH=357 /DNA_ID=CAMNT_0006832033 /DNA_START=23 /DNA_END=1096 /DNA_ORIENTATION=+
MPEALQRAIVRPVYKPGDRTDWANYRLISLISVVGKVLEACIAARISTAFEKANLFSDTQLGFRKGRRCAHAQMVLTETIKARAREGNTYVAFLDVRKAYPTTFRAAILTKLQQKINELPSGNANGQSRTWRVIHKMYERVMSFVRTSTSSDGADSDEYEVKHGLREGSSLSPLLYAIFIDDLAEALTEADTENLLEGVDLAALLYADDVALMAATAEDLQKLLHRAAEHANKNQYQFSQKKSKYVVFGDDTSIDQQKEKNLLAANDKSTGPIPMKHTDRYTYLGLELHEMLGAYWHCDQTYTLKREFINKAFIDEDDPESGPRIIIRVKQVAVTDATTRRSEKSIYYAAPRFFTKS